MAGTEPPFDDDVPPFGMASVAQSLTERFGLFALFADAHCNDPDASDLVGCVRSGHKKEGRGRKQRDRRKDNQESFLELTRTHSSPPLVGRTDASLEQTADSLW